MHRRDFLRRSVALTAGAVGTSLAVSACGTAPATGAASADAKAADAKAADAKAADSRAGAVAPGPAAPVVHAARALAPSTLPARRLGRSDLVLPVLGLGGFHVGLSADDAAAQALVEAALAEGIRFFDTAESYQDGGSERMLGAALAALGVRDQIVLMTKTFAPKERSAESAKRHLEGSLARLRTDRLDLWQLHSMQSVEDVDRAFAPGGAMEFILAQKPAGVVGHVGVTGHVNPAAHRRAIDWWDRGLRFEVMQFPVNPMDAHQLSFQKELLPLLAERDIGVLAMKTSAGGALHKSGVCSVDECLRYVLGLGVSLAIVGMESIEQVRHNAALVRGTGGMTPGESAALLARIEGRKDLALEWYKKA